MRAARRWGGMPVFVVVLLAGLLLYVVASPLGEIEERVLAPGFVVSRIGGHLLLTAVSTVAVLVIGIPLGILLTRPRARRLTPGAIAVANIGQATPSIGVLVVLALLFGIGPGIAIVALVIYSLLPVLRNTMVGLQQVDDSVIEAGLGMGLSRRAVLLDIELPLAVPVILAGVRTALILNVGTAALATFVNGGGLGDIINTGIVLDRTPVLVVGSVLTAAVALLVDWGAGIAEEALSPQGLRAG